MLDTPNLSITLDREGEEPIYRQLIRHIRTQIEGGTLSAGARLPASRDLARQLNISRISVVNAYAELRAEGYLSAHAGRGTFVAKESASAPGGGTPRQANDDGGSNPIDDLGPNRSLREMMRMGRKPGVISFGSGSPPAEFFPVHNIQDAISTVLERDGQRALNYEMPEGYGPLRNAVRDYVSALGIQCSPADVLITGGTQQALDLVIQSLLNEGDTLVTENPTYIGMIDIARTRRINLHGILTDEEGIRLDCLEHYIIDHKPRMVYVMPSFQNPTGHVMPLHRRRQLLNLANDYGVTILEDGIYHEFRFEGDPLPPLKALDENGVVIHASGFTKMLAPGMRIGYVIANNRYYQRLVYVKRSADISTSGLNQRALHLLLERGTLSGQLARNNQEMRRRRDAALDAAEKYLPPGTRWRVPEGGIVLWAELPHTGPTAAELYVSAIHAGVAYAIGNVFYTNGGGTYKMRLNYGAHPPEQIEEGFRRLGRAWRDLVYDYADMEKSPLL